MYLLFIAAAICADPDKIPDDVLTYLKAEESARDALIDVHQKEIAALKVAFKRAPVNRRQQIVVATKNVTDEIKRIEELSPFLYRFPGPPSIGALGRLDENKVIAMLAEDDTRIALVQVKHNKPKPGGNGILEEDVLSYVLVYGVPSADLKTLPKDDLYRAIRAERDSLLAEEALAKLPRASQASVGKKGATGPIRHLMVLEIVKPEVVDVHRDQFAKMRVRM